MVGFTPFCPPLETSSSICQSCQTGQLSCHHGTQIIAMMHSRYYFPNTRGLLETHHYL